MDRLTLLVYQDSSIALLVIMKNKETTADWENEFDEKWMKIYMSEKSFEDFRQYLKKMVRSLLKKKEEDNDWTADYKNCHAHYVEGMHFLGEGSMKTCDICIKRFNSKEREEK